MATGFCECGCGQATDLNTGNRKDRKWIQGEPKRFIRGHNLAFHGADYIIDEVTGCWNWDRYVNREGYGKYTNRLYAHIIYYERKYGKVPDGLVLDHLCRNTRCCNPEHLEAVTQLVNIRRGLVTKYNEATVKEIRSLHSTGLGYRKLSKLLGIPRTTVRYIVTRKSWKDV